MKKNLAPAKPQPRPFNWRVVALLSLALNVGLATWLLAQAGRTGRADAPRPTGPSGAHAALGSYLAENNHIGSLGWTEAQFADFLAGVRASYERRPLPLDDEAKKLRDEISQRVQGILAKETPNPVENYFKNLREKEGALQTPSGLHYRITEEGTGEKPGADDMVVISFAARQPDGRDLPELTRARVRMPVGGLLPGLAEGVQLLTVGGKALFFLPPELAFNETDWPANIPRGMPLGFFVELHEVVNAAAADRR